MKLKFLFLLSLVVLIPSVSHATVYYDNTSSTRNGTTTIGNGSSYATSFKLGTLSGSIPNATHLYLFTLDDGGNEGFWNAATQNGVYIGSDPGYACNPSWFGSTAASVVSNGYAKIDQPRNTAGCNAGASLSGDFGLYLGGSNIQSWGFATVGGTPILCLVDDASGTGCAFLSSSGGGNATTTWSLIMSTSTDQAVGLFFTLGTMLLFLVVIIFVAYMIYRFINN